MLTAISISHKCQTPVLMHVEIGVTLTVSVCSTPIPARSADYSRVSVGVD